MDLRSSLSLTGYTSHKEEAFIDSSDGGKESQSEVTVVSSSGEKDKAWTKINGGKVQTFWGNLMLRSKMARRGADDLESSLTTL